MKIIPTIRKFSKENIEILENVMKKSFLNLKYIVQAVFVLIFLAGGSSSILCQGRTARPAARSLLPKFNENAVVKIFSYKGLDLTYSGSLATYNYFFDPNITHGSGVMIDPNGIILTARHVIDSAKFIAVRIPGNNVTFPAEVVQSTDNSDYAFLVIKVQNQEFVSLPKKVPQLLRGQQIWTYGYPIIPGEPEPNITKGIITRFSKYFNMWQLDASVHSGSSGGPLVTDNGEIVGVIVAQLSDAEGMNFALPIDTILMTYKNLRDSEMFDLEKKTLTDMKPEKYKAQASLAKFLANTAIHYNAFADSEEFQTLKKEMEAFPDTSSIINEWASFKEISSGLYFNQSSQLLETNKKSFYSAKELQPADIETYNFCIGHAKSDLEIAKALNKTPYPPAYADLNYYITQAEANISSTNSEDSTDSDGYQENEDGSEGSYSYWTETDIQKLLSYIGKTGTEFKDYWGTNPTVTNENGNEVLTYSNLVVRLRDNTVNELSFYYNTLPNTKLDVFKGINIYLQKSTIISMLGNDYNTENLNKDSFNHEALTWDFGKGMKMTLVFSEAGYCYYLIIKSE